MKAIEAAKAAMIKARDVCLESSSPRSADEMVTAMLIPAIKAYHAALSEDDAAVQKVGHAIRAAQLTHGNYNRAPQARAAIRAMGGE